MNAVSDSAAEIALRVETSFTTKSNPSTVIHASVPMERTFSDEKQSI